MKEGVFNIDDHIYNSPVLKRKFIKNGIGSFTFSNPRTLNINDVPYCSATGIRIDSRAKQIEIYGKSNSVVINTDLIQLVKIEKGSTVNTYNITIK